MSKATRLKAVRRKQHNKTAKVRAREWKERCAVIRAEGEAARARRMAEAAAKPTIVEDSKPNDLFTETMTAIFGSAGIASGISHHLPGLVSGLRTALPEIWNPNGTLDIHALANRKLPLIDTEGFSSDTCSLKLGKDGVLDAFCEPSISMARKDFKVGDPKAHHTEQCMGRHRARYTEAGRIEAELLAKGEDALACYLYPTFMICTCDEPEDEDGSTPA